MKKTFQKVLSGFLTLSMLCPMTSAFAANTVEVTGITVLEANENGEAAPVATYAPSAENISLNVAQMLEITLKVEDDANTAVEDVYTAFLSYSDEVDEAESEATLSNETVQYVAQRKTDENGTVTVRFRPRATVGLGSFVAKTGAEDAITSALFSYEVTAVPTEMTLAAKNNSIAQESGEDVTFVIGGFEGTDYTGFNVSLDNTVLLPTGYSIALNDNNELILTINGSNFTNKVKGDSITVTVTHDGYTTATGTVAITAAVRTVTLNTNDGTIADGQNVTSYTEGTEVILPVPEKEHYTFVGWCETENLTDTPVTAIPADATGNKKYYAKWTPVSYGIRFELNGGTISDETPETYTYGVGMALPSNVTRENYHFTGWYTDASCTGDAVTSITATDSGNKTYYAGWSESAPTEYLITFLDWNNNVLKSEMVTVDTTPTCDTPTRESDGKYTYEFAGWTPEIVAVTGIATYTATYTSTPVKYSVTLNTNDGTIAEGTNVTEYTFGTAVTLPVPTRENYTFTGWYENEECTGEAVTEISASTTGDKTYYAGWKKNEEKTAIEVYKDYEDILMVERIVTGNADPIYTVTAKDDKTLPALVMYCAVYTSTGTLKSITEIQATTEGEKAAYTFASPQLEEGETYKVMLWEKAQKPVIAAITN